VANRLSFGDGVTIQIKTDVAVCWTMSRTPPTTSAVGKRDWLEKKNHHHMHRLSCHDIARLWGHGTTELITVLTCSLTERWLVWSRHWRKAW